MEHFRYLINLSILGSGIVKPMTSEIAKTFTGLTFLDSIPRVIPPGIIFGICNMYDEPVVFNVRGEEVSTDVLPAKIVKVVAELRDNIVTIGYMSHGEFYGVDAYQNEELYSRQGYGWLSPTFAPAYFKWVLGAEVPLRYAVFRDGIADLPKDVIIKRYTGSYGYVIVRSKVDGIFQGDEREIYYVDGMEGYE